MTGESAIEDLKDNLDNFYDYGSFIGMLTTLRYIERTEKPQFYDIFMSAFYSINEREIW